MLNVVRKTLFTSLSTLADQTIHEQVRKSLFPIFCEGIINIGVDFFPSKM